jgi:toluene monooxygenase system ferredoxin subunit
MKAFEVEGGGSVLVLHAADGYHAYQALCPHMDVPLEEGFYDGQVLTCHQHLWQWEAGTGAPVGLAEAALEAYALQEEGGTLWMRPRDPGQGNRVGGQDRGERS